VTKVTLKVKADGAQVMMKLAWRAEKPDRDHSSEEGNPITSTRELVNDPEDWRKAEPNKNTLEGGVVGRE
jgi:hypothetical protein